MNHQLTQLLVILKLFEQVGWVSALKFTCHIVSAAKLEPMEPQIYIQLQIVLRLFRARLHVTDNKTRKLKYNHSFYSFKQQ
jgi:hypothetical protein